MSPTAQAPTCATRPTADAAASGAPRTLVLGLGNPLLTDDSVGLRIVERLRPLLAGQPGLDLAADYCGGLRLMERLVGYDRAILVDAQRSGAPPGTIHMLPVLPAHAPATQHANSAHDVDLPTALELGYRAGARLPNIHDIRIVAVEAAEVELFGEECTPAVAAAVPGAVELVQSLLAEWR